MPFRVASSADSPRGAVRVNDELFRFGWTHFEVVNNNVFSADSFTCQFSVESLPFDRDRDWFSQQQDMYVELFIGFPPDPNSYSTNDLTSWIYGQVDDLDFDIVGGSITASGRDLTRVFIDAKTTEKWVNQTSSQIATALAQRHGLQAQVTPTKTRSGKFYEIDHVRMNEERSEWDILQYLAAREGFHVWVRGKTLFFQPSPDPRKVPPYAVKWYEPDGQVGYEESGLEVLHLKRALTVSRGVQVVIHSWNKKQKQGFTVSYPNKAKSIQVGKSTPFSGAQIFQRTIPNLTQEEALARAQALYQQIIAHEMKISDLELPGDEVLDITSIISLSGTGTAFDQLYFPDSIRRTFSFDGGFDMSVTAKNHAPESEIQTL